MLGRFYRQHGEFMLGVLGGILTSLVTIAVGVATNVISFYVLPQPPESGTTTAMVFNGTTRIDELFLDLVDQVDDVDLREVMIKDASEYTCSLKVGDDAQVGVAETQHCVFTVSPVAGLAPVVSGYRSGKLVFRVIHDASAIERTVLVDFAIFNDL